MLAERCDGRLGLAGFRHHHRLMWNTPGSVSGAGGAGRLIRVASERRILSWAGRHVFVIPTAGSNDGSGVGWILVLCCLDRRLHGRTSIRVVALAKAVGARYCFVEPWSHRAASNAV